MKKIVAIALTAVLTAGCTSSSSAATAASSTAAASVSESSVTVDSYTSASKTRTTLSGDDLAAAETALAGVSSDLASLADTKADGYTEPENAAIVQIMSVNPDGTPGMSTIHAWKYDADIHTVEVQLTDGQNAENLNSVGKRGTLLVHTDECYYLVHLNTTAVDELAYSDSAYDVGEFNSAYSGKDAKLSQFNITFSVLSIESTNVYMFA